MRQNVVLVLFGWSCLLCGCKTPGEGEGEEGALAVAPELPPDIRIRLDDARWTEQVGEGLGLWVSVTRQELYGIERGRLRFAYPCSTAKKGVGNRENSHQTPLGWHQIDERIGDGLPCGAVFKERTYTGQVWSSDQTTERDLILSRILWLRGLEAGVNAGPGVDSYARYIYIHGTPAEAQLGLPASLGCIRLSNKHVVELFDRTTAGTRVLITAW
jgi:hypothetical protein